MYPKLLLMCLATTLAPLAARADTLDLHGDGVDLALRMVGGQADSSAITSRADLSAKFNSLTANVRFSADAGGSSAPTGPAWAQTALGGWRSGRVGFDAAWTPASWTRVELSADDQVRQEIDSQNPVWMSAGDRRVATSQAQSLVKATANPISWLELRIGAGFTDQTSRSATASWTGPAATDLRRTQVQSVFSGATWRPLAAFSVEAGGKLEATTVSWNTGSAQGDGAYGLMSPMVAGSLTPWAGAAWRLSVERFVSPLRDEQIQGYAQVVNPQGLVLTPDTEWRYQATVRQHFDDDLDLSAGLLEADVRSVSYSPLVEGSRSPIFVSVGHRRQAEASLATPLHLFGLPAFAFEARAAWRESQVRDPATGSLVRLSGETPYDAAMTLSQSVGKGVRWGLTAQASGPAQVYQFNQMSLRSSVSGLGGFWAFNPGPLSIRLELDNLIGGDRGQRDIYFVGARQANIVGRIDNNHVIDRSFRIQFNKTL